MEDTVMGKDQKGRGVRRGVQFIYFERKEITDSSWKVLEYYNFS
jgi:hypothetical protein